MTSPEHILFICTANIDRSKTAEDLYAEDPRYEVRSAGVAIFATRRVTRELLLWAHRVFVMDDREDEHEKRIRGLFPELELDIAVLDVEDRWRRGHPDLVELLLERLRPHLGAPHRPRDGAQ